MLVVRGHFLQLTDFVGNRNVQFRIFMNCKKSGWYPPPRTCRHLMRLFVRENLEEIIKTSVIITRYQSVASY